MLRIVTLIICGTHFRLPVEYQTTSFECFTQRDQNIHDGDITRLRSKVFSLIHLVKFIAAEAAFAVGLHTR